MYTQVKLENKYIVTTDYLMQWHLSVPFNWLLYVY